jgi:2-phospho-L-lactate guanylyltransferase
MILAGMVLPIRAFALGKARLAEHLTPDDRAALGRRWANQVRTAAAGIPTVVVSSDPAVQDWAWGHGLDLVEDPGSLDGAASAGRDALAAHGCARIVIAHADLPHARTLHPVLRDGSQPVVVVVPCHRDDGTPVLSLPAAVEFDFAYGPDSFRRHVAEARRRGLGVRVVRDPDLGFDVDTPEDLLQLSPDLATDAAHALVR